jgi:hypothetical protein
MSLHSSSKKVLILQPPPQPSAFHMEYISSGDETKMGFLLSSRIPSRFSLPKKVKEIPEMLFVQSLRHISRSLRGKYAYWQAG